MTKIERRRLTVTLYQGNYEQELTDLARETLAAAEVEGQQGPARTGQRSKAMNLAKKHDAKKAEAEATAVSVTVWAVSRKEWAELADAHPPRDGDSEDKRRGVNMKTFPEALLAVSLVEPRAVEGGIAEHVSALSAEGQAFLDELDPSRVHYTKLETAAWNVNVGDDALPKYSLVSLLQAEREPDSKQPSEPE